MKRRHTLFITTVIGVLLGALPAAAEQSVDVTGSGWGHGVGMSQYGAKGMADEGFSGTEIIQHYYNGTSVVPLATADPDGWMTADPEPLWINLLKAQPSVTVQAVGGDLTLCQNEPEALLLRNGDTGPYVALLEQRLLDLGYDPGPVDQTFDGATDAAVRAFQSDNGLSFDGIVGPQTRVVLWPKDAAGENCVLATTILANSIPTLTALPDGTCRLEGLAPPGSCVGSIRNLAPAIRVALYGKVYDGAIQQFAHGTMRFRPKSSGSMHIVLQVGINDYTAGIAEVPASWPAAALEAQAIAARSYAVSLTRSRGPESSFSAERRDSCWCHLYSTAASQVYAGYNREIHAGGAWATAAHASDGQVITHPTATVVPAFYASSTGGKTENVEDVWGGSPRAYLTSVDDHWSKETTNPFATWTASTTDTRLAQIAGLDDVVSVNVVERNVSGSARTVRFVGTKAGEPVTVDVWGPTVASRLGLRSRYYDIQWPGPLPLDEPPTPPPPSAADTIGLHDARTGLWHLRRDDGTIVTFYYGDPRDTPYTGDWDCDGQVTLGLYRVSAGFLFLRNSNTQGIADIDIYYGIPDDVPIAGDWNGDGCDTVGIYRGDTFYLRNTNTQGIADVVVPFGRQGDVPITGDWDGDGHDSIGVYRPSTQEIILSNDLAGTIDFTWIYSGTLPGDRIVIGDWDGDGIDTVGVFRPSNATFYLRDSYTQSSANIVIVMGESWMSPVSGNWGG